jgi:outer membrane lipoprotein-sorting protein
MVAGGLFALLILASQHGVRSAPETINANNLVREMLANYQSANSFSETSECTIINRDGQEYIQKTQLKYKRPNLLYLETHDPIQGTLVSSCDGHIATFYTGSQNIYTHVTAPSTVALAVKDISTASERLIRTPQFQILSPLSFLSGKGKPQEAKDFQFVRMEPLEGRRVALITAQADPSWLTSMAPRFVQVKFHNSRISLWIDPVSKILVRASCDLQWETTMDNHKEPGAIRFVETHRDTKINALVRDEEFRFVPPKEAQEKF